MVYFIAAAIIASFLAARIIYIQVRRIDSGTDLMREVALAIREGAWAFLKYQYRTVRVSIFIFAAVLAVVISWSSGVAFILGAVMSILAGSVGIRIATVANVKTANVARKSNDIFQTLKTAFKGGSVIGLSIGGFALLGLGGIYLIFGVFLGQFTVDALHIHSNWLGIPFIPFAMTVAGYALGCSVVALYNRVGGGIYTKAADIGADLVGKAETGIPEDDPRNPATIADNVGDNVGDVAGLGADIMESYVAALISSVILASYMFLSVAGTQEEIDHDTIIRMFTFPLLFASIGLISSIIGIVFLSVKKMKTDLYRELLRTTTVAGGTTILFGLIATLIVFYGADFGLLNFKLGLITPWICTTLGILTGMGIGRLSERYTSYEYSPTQKTAEASREGAALTIIQGMSCGFKSVTYPLAVLSAVVLITNSIAGAYGIALAAIGMISFVASTISVDTFGPIIDNAGGICEMADLSDDVRNITDRLDSIGNTIDAIAKGYAIGSAALATLSLFSAYLYSRLGGGNICEGSLILNILNPFTLAGGLLGAALPFHFSGVLMESVANAARRMVLEVRRQLKIDPSILRGDGKPDYRQCIEISSLGAVQSMKGPALTAIVIPIIAGLLLGPDFVGGLIIGSLFTGVVVALYAVNAGGTWDNGKKFIEKGRYGGKGSLAHRGAIIGDTVGDPLKDTVGPALDILIKILAVVSLIALSIFGTVNVTMLFS